MPKIKSLNPFAWAWFKEPSEQQRLEARAQLLREGLEALEAQRQKLAAARDYNSYKLRYFTEKV